MKKIILACGFCLLTSLLFSQQIKSENLKKHIKYLASDKLKGRATGSQEELTAANYIANNFSKYKLEQKGNLSSYFYSYKFRKPKSPHDTIGGAYVSGLNVVGYLDNNAENTIIIGGHYDHLGLGMDHNSLDANPEGKIHNGADDNASGTAGVLELARYFSQNNRKEKFNFLFICFSGEELGLYGSKKFCENPTIDFSKVNYMINLDMIGRLADSTNKLMLYGVGTSADWIPLLDKINSGFSIKKDSAGIGPSDQTSFYLKNIPVLAFFTGQHSDYHKPSDDWQKINFKGEVKVLEYVIKVIEETESLPKMKFLETKNTEEGKTSFKVTLGIMPDYTFDGKGLRVDGVTKGKTADAAGLLKGDIILQMGDVIVNEIHDYMKALSKFNKGDSTEVIILRDGKNLKKQVNF